VRQLLLPGEWLQLNGFIAVRVVQAGLVVPFGFSRVFLGLLSLVSRGKSELLLRFSRLKVKLIGLLCSRPFTVVVEIGQVDNIEVVFEAFY